MKLEWADDETESIARVGPFVLTCQSYVWRIEFGQYCDTTILQSEPDGDIGTRDKSKAAAEAALRKMLRELNEFVEGGE